MICAGVAWVGDYLPAYKLAPEMSTIINFIESRSAKFASDLFDNIATSNTNDALLLDSHTSGLEAPVLQLLRRSVSKQKVAVPLGGRWSSSRNSSSDHTIRLEVSLRSALPAHATDEAALKLAKSSVLAPALEGTPPAITPETESAQRAVATWAPYLLKVCDAACVIHRVSAGLVGIPPTVVLTIPLADVPAVVSYLAIQSDVNWISPTSKIQMANFYAGAITQTGQCVSTFDTSSMGNTSYVYNDEGKHPMWAAGLTGVLWQVRSGLRIQPPNSCNFFLISACLLQ